MSTTRTFREEYQAIRDKYDTNPYQHSNHNFEENNPLSQKESVIFSINQLIIIYSLTRLLNLSIFFSSECLE